MTDYFFQDPEINLETLFKNKALKKLSEEDLSTLLQTSFQKLNALADWNEQNLQDTLNELLVETNTKPAALFSAIRIAVSFAPFSPALPLTLNVLGKNTSLARIQNTITAIEND